MLKNKSKAIAIIAIVMLVFSFAFTYVYATDVAAEEQPAQEPAATPSDAASTDQAAQPATTSDGNAVTADNLSAADEATDSKENKDIHEGDLYIFDQTVNMDQLVDGNVYIFGNDVTISGQINGNLFVFANNLKFDNSYVRFSVYACANKVEFNGACNDLYIACTDMNVAYDSYVSRDVKASVANNLSFIGAIGRNADIYANSLNFGEGEQAGLIYGNLNYSSPNEIEIADGIVEGNVNYTPDNSNQQKVISTQEIIKNYVIDLVQAIVFTLVVFVLISWLTPKFVSATSDYASVKIFKGFGIGLLACLVAIIAGFILLISNIATPVGFALLTLFGLLISLGFATLATAITKKFVSDDKKGKTFGILTLVTICLWVLEQIPFIGGFATIFVSVTGLGIIVAYAFRKNKKEVEDKKD